MANFKARELRGRLQGPPTARVADFKARELRGRLQGPPAAWPTCDPFRRWPSVSTRGKAPVPKSRRRGQDEPCLPHYMAPKEAQSNGQHPACVNEGA